MLATSGNESILSFLRRAFHNPVRGFPPHSSPKLHGLARLGNWTDKKKRMGAATVYPPGKPVHHFRPLDFQAESRASGPGPWPGPESRVENLAIVDSEILGHSH